VVFIWFPLLLALVLPIAEIARATLESIYYQTNDLRVDGGMVANDWLMQFLSDLLNLPVHAQR
jgi:glycerol kinase